MGKEKKPEAKDTAKKEVKKKKAQGKAPAETKEDASFTPERFSVKGLRKHQGVKTSRNPKVIR